MRVLGVRCLYGFLKGSSGFWYGFSGFVFRILLRALMGGESGFCNGSLLWALGLEV